MGDRFNCNLGFEPGSGFLGFFVFYYLILFLNKKPPKKRRLFNA